MLRAGVAAAISAALAACGSSGEGGPTAQFGVPIVTVIGAPPASVAFGDVDRDGHLDLAVTGCLTAPCAPDAVSLFTMGGKGDGTFGAPVALPTQYPIAQSVPLIADFSADGWPDVAVVWSRPTFYVLSEWKELAIFLGTATGTTPAAGLTVSLGPLKPGHVADGSTADVDRDGKPDLMVYTSSIDGGAGFALPKLNRGDGTFTDAEGVRAPRVLQSRYALADFNDDRKLDLVIGMGDLCQAPMNLFLGNGDGNFGPAVPIDVKAPADVPVSDARHSYTPVIAGDQRLCSVRCELSST